MNMTKASDFPPGTKFFEVEGIPVAWPSGSEPLGCIANPPRPLSWRTSLKLAYEHEITPEEFDEWVIRTMAEIEDNS